MYLPRIGASVTHAEYLSLPVGVYRLKAHTIRRAIAGPTGGKRGHCEDQRTGGTHVSGRTINVSGELPSRAAA